jgi:(1->4)-alpha-D-glucan 1-alpha-D-glucosylmutase
MRTPPRATYRLQLHAGFTFADARAAVPYLVDLGISHLYLSPVLQAAPGSTHGYDVVDPDRVSTELGGEDGFRALVEAAHAAGLGILLDIVPNHMSIAGTHNRWWRDVLENGPASYYASAFDVDWTVDDNRVLLPVLGERYGRALFTGILGVERTDGRFELRAHDERYPVSPRTLGPVIRDAGRRIDHAELEYLGEALAALPSSREREHEARLRRHRHRAVLLARLAALCAEDPAVDAAITAEIAAVNTDPLALDALLEAQNYRLVHWTVAGNQLSYRRFFDVTSLVGIRTEDPDVLAAGHRRIFGWLADGSLDGVRIDHVDGLREPRSYMTALRERAPEAWILVEKILGAGECIPADWPIDGTSGYEHGEQLGRLIVDPDAAPRLAALFTAYTGVSFEPAFARRNARLEVMTDALHSEIERVTELAVRACATSPLCRDFTRPEIRTALSEILAGYPVYRTYLGEGTAAPEDRARITAAVDSARAARPDLDGDLLGFLESALALELPSTESHELARVVQQVSGPIVAKGDEDTLAYRQVALASRCEVGSDLEIFGAAPEAVHAHFAQAAPRGLIATSTHDTKRSEDVRARIAVISELPELWAAQVVAWGERAAAGWGEVARDRVLEYLMWQTLVGAWPLPCERAQRYAEKASREARLRTSWRAPDAAYEAARDRWIAGIYADTTLTAEIAALAEQLAVHGDRNALAMLLVKLAAPGIPDIYQGCELRADQLVDPDNRAPVDLALRGRELRAVSDLTARDVAGDLSRAKLFAIRRVLGLRRRAPDLFEGAYRPLRAQGPHADRVFAFARGSDLIAVVGRLGAGADGWRATTLELPPGMWRDVLSDTTHPGGALDVTVLWTALPIALLVSDAARERMRSPGIASK